MPKATKKTKKPAKMVKKTKKVRATKKTKSATMVKKSVKKSAKKGAGKAKSKARVKAKKVAPIPKGYHSITPYLVVGQGANAIEFYKKAFGAKELMRFAGSDGKIKHAELQVGDSRFMMADEHLEYNTTAPQPCHGSPVGLHLYVKDVDAVLDRAVAAGAKLSRAAQNMFYGDRTGMIVDPFGHHWSVSTHIEDVSSAQMKKRVAEMCNHKESCETHEV